MEAVDALIADLTQLVKSGTKHDRAKTFMRVTELYFTSIDLLKDEHVAFFDDVLGLLVDHVDTQTRTELSQRIASLELAPFKLIRHLANDDEIAVAGPVISRSGQLTSDDLTMLAKTKSQAHLLAISGRDQLDATVTDALVDRGDSDVVRNVAKNAGAEFNNDCFARLAQRAQGDDLLAESVGSRPDIPVNILRALASHATDTVRSRILAAASPEMKAEIESALDNEARNTSVSIRDYSQARKLVMEMHGRRKLNEWEIIEFATSNKFEETVAALSVLCTTPIDIIENFMNHNPAEAMPVVCRAAGLSWRSTEAVIMLCPAVGGTPNHGVLRLALANFSKLNKSTSEKLLRFWFVRGSGGNSHRQPEQTAKRPHVEWRRKHKRRPVNLPAVILVDGEQISGSTIIDLSMGGAKIKPPPSFNMPDKFVLCLSADSKIRRQCEIRWRSRETVGVQFMS